MYSVLVYSPFSPNSGPLILDPILDLLILKFLVLDLPILDFFQFWTFFNSGLFSIMNFFNCGPLCILDHNSVPPILEELGINSGPLNSGPDSGPANSGPRSPELRE